jgi:hypothetical protein
MTTSTATTSRTYSRGVSENCTATEKASNDFLVPHVCLFVRGLDGGLFPNNHTEAFATAFNTSSLNQIVMYDQEYALLVPVSTDIRLDFIATTAAIKSTRKLKNKECNLDNILGPVTSFNCSVNSMF